MGPGADLAQVVRGHESNSCRAQYAVAVEDATVLQHLQKLRIIERSRNHALAARFPFGGESHFKSGKKSGGLWLTLLKPAGLIYFKHLNNSASNT